MSEEQKNAIDGGEQPSVEEISSDKKNESPTQEAEKELDEKVRQAIGEHNLSALEEKSKEEKPDENPEAKQPEKKEKDEVSEKKIEESEEESKEAPKETTQPGRLDRRIAKLYLSNRLLKGEEGDPASLDQIALEIQSYPLEEKQKALHRLLAENKSLRGGKDDGVAEFSEEDYEAIVEAKAEQMFQEMQGEIQEREWRDDLIKTVDSHPELDENAKEYNPKIAVAVERLVKNGMKCSEAYSLVAETIAEAQGKKDEEAKADKEFSRQKALSGAVSATHDFVEPKGKLTWEDVVEIQKSDPEKYMKLVREGKLPTE